MSKSWKSTSGAVQGMIDSKTLAASTRGRQTCGKVMNSFVDS